MKIEADGMRLGRGGNDREHPLARHRRVKLEKEAMAWRLSCFKAADRPATPCTFTLTRVAPSDGLDDDNLTGSLKAVRDAVAAWIGVDDKLRNVVRYRYEQARGPWAVIVESQEGIV